MSITDSLCVNNIKYGQSNLMTEDYLFYGSVNYNCRMQYEEPALYMQSDWLIRLDITVLRGLGPI